jgi:glucosamine-6-phosphate deaminase
MEARKIVLMASGPGKRKIVEAAIMDKPSADIPATFLQFHTDITYCLDTNAAPDCLVL